jgi:hypothetical protein
MKKGYKLSEKTRERMHLVHLGKKLSEEHKRKIREAILGKYYGRRK